MLSFNRLWSPEINDKFIKAAIQAELHETVDLVHEPEAAAIHCLADRLQQLRRPYNGVVRELTPLSSKYQRSSDDRNDAGVLLAVTELDPDPRRRLWNRGSCAV